MAHLVPPLSRRSNQIVANRQMRVAEWRAAHPGQEPDHDVLTAIDRSAWAAGRPNKPGVVDEASWASLVRDELRALDPDVLAGKLLRVTDNTSSSNLGGATRIRRKLEKRSIASVNAAMEHRSKGQIGQPAA